MPSFPIIDAHLHLWDTEILRYPWLDPIPELNKPFLLKDYRDATQATRVEKMVFVQCECEPSQSEDEVRWITELAGIDKRIAGIVAWAPLELGLKAKEVLDRYSKNPLVKGIRRIIQFEADPEFCLQEDFIRGVQLLPEYGFSFEICIAHHQMTNAIRLVERCPRVVFVLDHIGKPNIKSQEIDPWRSKLKALAGFENVYCKISGLVTEADHKAWKEQDLLPFATSALHYFGPDRLIFGGDWPVALQASGYQRWVDTVDSMFSGLSKADQLKMYKENAEKFYRLV